MSHVGLFLVHKDIEGNVLPLRSTRTLYHHVQTKFINVRWYLLGGLRVRRHAAYDTYTLSRRRCKVAVLVLFSRKSVVLDGTHSNI